jgi:hypothetical protein
MIRLTTLLLLLLFLPGQSFSQPKRADITRSIGIGYEHKYFHNGYQSQLKAISSIPDFNRAGQYLSFNYFMRTSAGGRKGEYYYNPFASVSTLITQRISVNDSLHPKLNGWNFTLNFIGITLGKSPKIAVIINVGAKLASLRLDDSKIIKMKNTMLGPCASVYLRGSVNSFSFFSGIQYDYDVTSGRWTKPFYSKIAEINLPELKQSGLTLAVGIGINLKK